MILLVEVGGVEPPSRIMSILSHSQVYLVYYHKLTKIAGFPCAYRPVALHQY